MTIMIGIDPHKATHTAVASDEREVVLDEFKIRASKSQVRLLCDWRTGSRNGNGRSNQPTGSAIWLHGSLSRPVRQCSMFPDAGIACSGVGIGWPWSVSMTMPGFFGCW